MSTPKVEVKPIEEAATFDPQNVNKHTTRGHQLVENSLRRRGANRSVASAGKGVDVPVLTAGNLTYEKAVDAGYKEVVNVYVDGSQLVNVVRTDIEPGSAEAIALGLEDNESASKSYSIDLDVLAAVAAGDNAILSALRAEDKVFDSMVEGMGLKEETKDAAVSVDRAAELLEKWQVKTGDLWQLGEHRLICGDCTDAATVERVMDGEKADATITDPPYGIDKEKIEGDEDLSVWINSINPSYEVMQDESFYCCFVSVEKMMDISDYLRRCFTYKWQIIQYVNNGMVRGGVGFSVYMAVLVFCKGNAKARNLIRDVRETSNSSEKAAERMHPYEKDVLFVGDIVNYSTRDGGRVYEPFSGSGTTLIACENLSRKCRAIEISPAYVAVTLERYSQAFPDREIKKL